MTHHDVTVVILAGGQGRRMGGRDKGLLMCADKPIIEHILAAIHPQCQRIIINANRHIDDYLAYGYPVINDDLNDFQGPLAGIAVGLAHTDTPLMMTLPCDAPMLPNNLVQRLKQVMQQHKADISVVHDGERMQPMYALMQTHLASHLQDFLNSGERQVKQWYAQHHLQTVDCSDVASYFQNINTPAQQQALNHVINL